MTTTPAQIVLYSDPQAQTATASIFPSLREAFPEADIIPADTEALRTIIQNNYADMIVIPGILSEKSRYFDLMGGDEGQRQLGRFVENGGLLMTVCAGSYLVSKDTEYIPPWGVKKTRSNRCAIFNGLAQGPLAGMGQNPTSETNTAPKWYDDCTVVKIRFKNEDGNWQSTGVVYGNGPALTPYEEDESIEVLARYEDTENAPIAAAWKTKGKGAVLWLGVLPHTGYQVVDKNPSTIRITRLMDALKPHEKGRAQFWSILVKRIKDKINQDPEQDFQQRPVGPASGPV